MTSSKFLLAKTRCQPWHAIWTDLARKLIFGPKTCFDALSIKIVNCGRKWVFPGNFGFPEICHDSGVSGGFWARKLPTAFRHEIYNIFRNHAVFTNFWKFPKFCKIWPEIVLPGNLEIFRKSGGLGIWKFPEKSLFSAKKKSEKKASFFYIFFFSVKKVTVYGVHRQEIFSFFKKKVSPCDLTKMKIKAPGWIFAVFFFSRFLVTSPRYPKKVEKVVFRKVGRFSLFSVGFKGRRTLLCVFRSQPWPVICALVFLN